MIAVDTSVAVPLLVAAHNAHDSVVRWWAEREVVLSGHALAETYSVLTRLPGDARVSSADAAVLIARRFSPPLLLSPEASGSLPGRLADLGISGGAVYDAMVALAAAEANCVLATRDARARATYDTVGVSVEVVA